MEWLLIIIIAILLLGPELIWALFLFAVVAGVALIAIGGIIAIFYQYWEGILALIAMVAIFSAVCYGIERAWSAYRGKHH